MPSNIQSMLALKELKGLHYDSAAREKLNELKAEYTASRKALRVAARKFKNAKKDVNLPVPLKLPPYQHQVRAFGFATTIDHPALFMDQGTGKTMVAIAVAGYRMLRGQVKRLLVLCPKNVIPVWVNEFNKHADFPFAINPHNPPSAGEGLEVCVINYDSFRTHVKRMMKWKPDMVICDESHKIKNRSSKQTGACWSISKTAKFRMILTGTPFAKCISEVWSQFRFLNDQVYGRGYTHFKGKYLEMGGYMNYQVVGFKNEEEFGRKMHENAFRVMKEDCLDLPETTYQNVYVPSDKKTRDLYAQMERDMFIEQDGEEATASSAAVLAMKLRQMSGGAVRSDNQEMIHVSEKKVKELGSFLESRIGKKTVVFFSFTHEIVLAQKLAKNMKMKAICLQGSTPQDERDEFEEKFQNDPTVELAYINIGCGAEGLTLHAADTAVFFSPSFSFIGYAQARDRIRRIGQDKKTQIIFIIMENTMDERVVSVLECNGQLVDTYLDNNRNYKIGNKKMAKSQETTSYNVAAIAEELSITPADVRKHLRGAKVEKPEGGWNWSKKSDFNTVVKAVKQRIKDLESSASDKPAKGKSEDKKSEGKKGKGKGKKAGKSKAEETIEQDDADASTDLESMDIKALVAHAEGLGLKVPAAKKRSKKNLIKFINESATDSKK